MNTAITAQGATAPAVAENEADPLAELLPELPDYLEESLKAVSDDNTGTWNKPLASEDKQTFIRAFVKAGGGFLKACEAIKISPPTAYLHLRRDAEWMASLRLAKLSLGEGLQGHLHHLAMKENGTLATLALLKNRYFPKVYKDAAPQVNVGVAVQFAPSSIQPPA